MWAATQNNKQYAGDQERQMTIPKNNFTKKPNYSNKVEGGVSLTGQNHFLAILKKVNLLRKTAATGIEMENLYMAKVRAIKNSKKKRKATEVDSDDWEKNHALHNEAYGDLFAEMLEQPSTANDVVINAANLTEL